MPSSERGPESGTGSGGTDGAPAGASFRRLDERELFRSHLFWVGGLTVADPEGETFTRQVVHHPGAVAVVPVGDDGTVTLVRQYRPAIGRYLLEVPAGTCDEDGEEADDTARRELAEEAGLEAGALRRLAAVYNTPGYSDQVTQVYLATELTPCATNRSGVEERFMDAVRVPLDALPAAAARGEIADATTMVGLLLAEQYLAARGPSAD